MAFRCGSVPEIIEDGLTGRIVSNVDEAVRSIPGLLTLDRRLFARFEQRFSAARMTADYLKINAAQAGSSPIPSLGHFRFTRCRHVRSFICVCACARKSN